MDLWGPGSDRRFFGDEHWDEPLAWNRAAIRAGVRHRVFCASMADVFEDRRDLDAYRERLWRLVEATPGLDWLLLTKRPEFVAGTVPWQGDWPANVWMGTSVEEQRWAEKRLPPLAAIPAAVRFISAEPLLGYLDLRPWMASIDWVIAGGESGGRSRPTDPAWLHHLLGQCRRAEVPFFFKQWGEWSQVDWPEPLRARTVTAAEGSTMQRLGRKATGRKLSGCTWDEVPTPRAAAA